ncbi:hypothetical protein LBMAG18_00240 [Alphaproteobacteria bacterium]|nr:hypothetical protein LBMAG18_00240 [Alphaproteobacteria bacterium]
MIESIFIKSSQAQETVGTVSNNQSLTAGSFIPLILIFVVFYFLIIRPQNKKIKEHQEFVNNLKIGSKVITNSGIIGVIREIDKKTNIIDIEIAPNIIVKMLKNYVTEFSEKKDEKENNSQTKKN